MNVVGDAGACSFAEVESHVEAARFVDLPQGLFGALGEEHQLVSRLSGHGGERGQVLVGHDHDMAGGVWVGVEADKAVRVAMHDVDGLFGGLAGHAVGNGVVDGGDHIAEDAVLVLSFRRRPGVKGGGDPGSCLRVCVGDVTIAPGRPEAIHSPSIAADGSRVGEGLQTQIIFAVMIRWAVLCIQSVRLQETHSAGMTWR